MRRRNGRSAGTLPAPPSGGLLLTLPGIGRTRGVSLTVSEAAAGEAVAAVQGAAPDAARVQFSALQWNSWLAEIWSIATVVRNPARYITARSGTTESTVFYPMRLVDEGDTPRNPYRVRVREVASTTADPPGMPIIGTDLLVDRRTTAGAFPPAHWDPSADGLQPLERERRTYALAAWECVQKLGEAAQTVPASTETPPPRDGAGWWIGAAVVAVGVLVFSVAYGTDAVVQAERAAATDARCLTEAMRAYELRLAEWRRTGTMPPAGEVETQCAAVRDRLANDGWTRLRNAASEIIADTARGVSSTAKWVIGGLVAYKVLGG